jgi:hypothetical protein
MALTITSDGHVVYSRQESGRNTSIDAPLKKFEGNDFLVGMGPISTRFIVSAAPHRDGTTWKMTVDGVELTKTTTEESARDT